MLERYKTLAAVLALQRFTVADLARFSGVKEGTVRTILKRESPYVERLGVVSHTRPGGRFVQYRLRPEAEAELLSELRQLERVGARAMSAARDPKGQTVQVPTDLIAAEDILLTRLPSTKDPDDRRRLVRLARLHFTDSKSFHAKDAASTVHHPEHLEVETHTRAVDILIRLAEAENVASTSPAQASAALQELRNDLRDFLARFPSWRTANFCLICSIALRRVLSATCSPRVASCCHCWTRRTRIRRIRSSPMAEVLSGLLTMPVRSHPSPDSSANFRGGEGPRICNPLHR